MKFGGKCLNIRLLYDYWYLEDISRTYPHEIWWRKGSKVREVWGVLAREVWVTNLYLFYRYKNLYCFQQFVNFKNFSKRKKLVFKKLRGAAAAAILRVGEGKILRGCQKLSTSAMGVTHRWQTPPRWGFVLSAWQNRGRYKVSGKAKSALRASPSLKAWG